LEDDGNLFDACLLAAVACLRNGQQAALLLPRSPSKHTFIVRLPRIRLGGPKKDTPQLVPDAASLPLTVQR
jgi:hypothetical protein